MIKTASVVCWVLGGVFVAAGAATIAFGEAGDQHHNLLHLATGLVALVTALTRDRWATRIFCLVFGAGYLGFGTIGLLAGDPRADRLWHVGVLHLATGDHTFHVVLGGVVLAAGLLSTLARRPGRGDGAREPSTAGPGPGDGARGRRAAHRVVVGALVAAAAGVVTMALSGVAFSATIPPGVGILLVPAGLVAIDRWRWPPVLAAGAALFVLVGYIPSGAATALVAPDGSGAFVGLWLQFAGAGVAVVAATVLALGDYRPRTVTARAGG